MGWSLLANHLIASATDSEDIHALLQNFLSPHQYYRFSPILPKNIAIDEKDPMILKELKELAKEDCRQLFDENTDFQEKARYDSLIKKLRGKG
jgi:hypothetical protein